MYDYDVDEQYAIIKNTIIEERITAQNGGEVSTLKAYAQLFKRPDLVSDICPVDLSMTLAKTFTSFVPLLRGCQSRVIN